MSHNFSPSMTLAGMDYIAPSAACVKPTMTRVQPPAVVRTDHLSSQPQSQAGTTAAERGEVLKITLQDCLACSGCVTTAETVLVNAQSRAEILKARAADSTRPWLVTISDASAASIAGYTNTTVSTAFEVIAGFMEAVLTREAAAPPGRVWVSDLHLPLHLSTVKTAEEYARRRREAPETLPLIVSACPGWVCYCEKQGSAVLPLLCPVMSPQGIAGSLAKRAISMQLYHVSIQPCFDRKLEAARDCFRPDEPTSLHPEGNQVPYTDCVLSTQELLEWMHEVDPALPWRRAMTSVAPAPSFPQVSPPVSRHAQELDGHDEQQERGAAAADAEELAGLEGSGGYHRRVIDYRLAEERRAGPVQPADVADIRYEVKRNKNHQLASCTALPGEVFCVAFGFQQIQNVVRGLRRRLPAVRAYSFIEMMACPGGCLNGGGQVRQANQPSEQTLTEVKQKFVALIQPPLPSAACAGDEQGRAKEVNSPVQSRPRLEPQQLRFLSMTLDDVDALAAKVGPALWSCVFHDRQHEFEKMLDEGNVHSLRW